METEEENQLPFLDVLVQSKEGMQPDYIGVPKEDPRRSLPPLAVGHTTIHRSRLVRCPALRRAKRVCTGLTGELQHLFSVFQANGNHIWSQMGFSRSAEVPKNQRMMSRGCWCYHTSRDLARRSALPAAHSALVKTVFKSSTTLRSLLIHVKTPTPP